MKTGLSVKYIHTAKDNEIDVMECSECGRTIKHAVEINGKIFGLDCGARKLGFPYNPAKKSAAVRKVYEIQTAVSRFNLYQEKRAKYGDQNYMKHFRDTCIEVARAFGFLDIPNTISTDDLIVEIENRIAGL